MDARQIRDDLKRGKLDVDGLIELIVQLSLELSETTAKLAETTAKLSAAERRIAELESKSGGPSGEKLPEAYSLAAEERRRRRKALDKAKRKRLKRGRMKSLDKLKLAVRTEQVFPDGVSPEQCVLSHTRPVWRLEDGVAVVVAYEVWRHGNSYGRVPNVLGRSEFGIEFMLAVAYQVYVVGLSLDKVALLTEFFQRLKLRKSQIDGMLNQLARHWEGQFDTLCGLLANSMIVHADETSWSIHSTWTFLSEKARLLVFGINKDAATLEKILDPETFEGLVISDNAAVYARFSNSQKCWAHLLRKAIRLTLLEPNNERFRTFCDELLDIYRSAVRIREDARMSPAGLQRKVIELDERVTELCIGDWSAELPKQQGAMEEYRLLINELMKLMIDRELFRFVTTPDARRPNGTVMPASGTNNEAERTLRNPATSRVTGRTSKTAGGARRQTIIHSVLESTRCYLKEFRLDTLIEEVGRWIKSGVSCFERTWNKLPQRKRQKHPGSTINRLFPPIPAPDTG